MAAKATSKRSPSHKEGSQTEVQRYLDALIENQKIFNEALEGVRKRGIRVGEELAKRMAEDRIEALELAKQLADDPTAYSDNFKAVIEASTNAQSRAIEFFKDLSKEQAEGQDEMRKTASALADSSREAAAAAVELARSWTMSNPVVDAVQRTMESVRS